MSLGLGTIKYFAFNIFSCWTSRLPNFPFFPQAALQSRLASLPLLLGFPEPFASPLPLQSLQGLSPGSKARVVSSKCSAAAVVHEVLEHNGSFQPQFPRLQELLHGIKPLLLEDLLQQCLPEALAGICSRKISLGSPAYEE